MLYQPQTALRLALPVPNSTSARPVGENPPAGAMIDYYFKTAPKDEVTLDILDTNGKVVRHLSSKEKKENEQPPEWPDRVASAQDNSGEGRDEPVRLGLALRRSGANPGSILFRRRSARAARAAGRLPGRLTAGGKSQTAPLHLVVDPRIQRYGSDFAETVRTFIAGDGAHHATAPGGE